jgi:sulfite reductase alpha subunit-like flavoprotein
VAAASVQYVPDQQPTQGEGTDNAKGFFEWLKANEREEAKSKFSPLRFAVFGLGKYTRR